MYIRKETLQDSWGQSLRCTALQMHCYWATASREDLLKAHGPFSYLHNGTRTKHEACTSPIQPVFIYLLQFYKYF